MTANQIAFNKYLEDVRTHKVQEGEMHRSNVTQETETHRANVAREMENSRANTLNYEASMYATNASMRNAELNAETQRQVAAINSATSLQVAAINADTAKRGQDVTREGNLLSNQVANRKATLEYEIQKEKNAETTRANISREKIDSTRTVIDGILGATNMAMQVGSSAAFAFLM